MHFQIIKTEFDRSGEQEVEKSLKVRKFTIFGRYTILRCFIFKKKIVRNSPQDFRRKNLI